MGPQPAAATHPCPGEGPQPNCGFGKSQLQVDHDDPTFRVFFSIGGWFEGRVRVNWKLQARPCGASIATLCLFPATYLLDNERVEHGAYRQSRSSSNTVKGTVGGSATSARFGAHRAQPAFLFRIGR